MIQIPRGRSVALRVGGELLVIIVGVLIALALDSWNQGRQDSRTRDQYLDRLIADLRADSTVTDSLFLDGLRMKMDALAFLAGVASRAALADSDAVRLVSAIPKTLQFSFNAPPARTVTIDDLRSTGHLSLIGSGEMREDILEYYWWATNSEERLEGRMTRYSQAAFERVPPAALASSSIIPEREVSANAEAFTSQASKQVVDVLLEWLGEKETQELINAERNYALHAVQIGEDQRDRASELMRSIERSRR